MPTGLNSTYSGQVNGKLKVEWRAGEGLYAQREETRGTCCENWLNLSDSQTWSSCEKNGNWLRIRIYFLLASNEITQ